MARLINVETVLVNLKGENLEQPGEKEGDMEDFTLGDALIGVLLQPDEQGKTTKPKEKVRRYKLATKIHNSSDVEFDVDDLSLMKKLVGERHAPLIVGQVWSILDPKEEDDKEKEEVDAHKSD